MEVDVPEFLARIGSVSGASELQKAVGDHALIAYYYLLRIGEYTVKLARNNTKQTVQFKLEDVTFFKKDSGGQLRKLPRIAPRHDIMTADSATLKLDNQKNGWKESAFIRRRTERLVSAQYGHWDNNIFTSNNTVQPNNAKCLHILKTDSAEM